MTQATDWTRNTAGCDSLAIDRFTIIVWTGSPDVTLDDGYQVCSAYIPIGDREYPDGLMIVGRRILDTRDRATARTMATKIALDAIGDWQSARVSGARS